MTQAANDKEQLHADDREAQGAAEGAGSRPSESSPTMAIFSEANVEHCEAAQDRAADRDGALSPSSQLEAALCRRAQIPADSATALEKMAYRLKTPRGKRTLRAAQTDARTGVRHHQIGDGLSAMSAARARERQRRMEFGDDELEHQANVRDAALLRGHRDPSPHSYRSTST